MSKNDLQVRLRSASGDLNGFVVALVWFTPSNKSPAGWTKRAIMMELKKALGLLKEPLDDDLPTIRRLKAVASDIPLHSASVDGAKTEPTADT